MPKPSQQRRVVVTGYGMVTPLGRNTEETFKKAAQGESGIGYITRFDTSGLPCRIGGEVDEAWLGQPDAPRARRLEKFCSRGVKLMLAAAEEAARQARLDTIARRERIGVALGSHGDNPSLEDIMLLHRFYDGSGHWNLQGLLQTGGYSSFAFARRKPDVAMAILANLFRCTGPNLSIVSACSAGSQAIGEGFRLIRDGQSDVVLAGGCEATLNFVGLAGFVLIKALAERYKTPQTASRPFDRKRNGFVMSEGAGAMILEELDHARAREIPILGEVLGYGDSADAYRITDPDPQGEGAVLAMNAAIVDASLTPNEIDYINAHGTSTVQNDLIETLAIKQVFGGKAGRVPISSNKSMLGHTIAAAGAIEAILTLVGIERSLILPTINYTTPDPRCDLDYVPNAARSAAHRVALSNSFGFGGQNACLCLAKFEGQRN
jgi:3-oxoacyl-[acyl-carrier-protein] synthase II